MRFFHYISRHRSSNRLSQGVALLLGMALVGFASVAQADSQVSPMVAEAGGTIPLAVSGPSDSPRVVVATRRSSFIASSDAYVGMTRASERLKIQSVDPTDWLAKFGDVEAAPTH